jgi:hypothetical protein
MKTKLKLGMNGMRVTELMGFATHAVSKMTGNSFFPTPNPPLVKVTNATAALQNAFNLAQGAGPVQTATMNQNRALLETLLIALGHYVEDIANDPVNSSTGADAIILSAGMDLKSFSPHQKQTFSVSVGGIPGTVDLTGESVKRGSHEWQYSLDPANASGWVNAIPTVQAATTISGLEIGKRYYFRHRIVAIDGPTDWNEPESIIVS